MVDLQIMRTSEIHLLYI